MKPVKSILLVCTGNSCRSIMAEGYLKKRLRESGLGHIEVESAGTGAMSGFSPTPEAIEVMKEIDTDVSGYVSTPLTEAAINNADLVLVMGPLHKQRIAEMALEKLDSVYFLREFSQADVEERFIPDPIGKPVDFYREVRDVIVDSIEGFIKWLKE